MLSVSAKKVHFYHQNTHLDTSQTNYRNIIGRNPSMVIPLLANQDLTPMLPGIVRESSITLMQVREKKTKTNYLVSIQFSLQYHFG